MEGATNVISENEKIILLFGIICLLCSVLSLSACGSSNQDNPYELNFSELNMKVGESERLELSGNGVIILEGVEWSSSVESVATVENGRVQASVRGKRRSPLPITGLPILAVLPLRKFRR